MYLFRNAENTEEAQRTAERKLLRFLLASPMCLNRYTDTWLEPFQQNASTLKRLWLCLHPFCANNSQLNLEEMYEFE